ncbi:MAG: hypothetical protein M0P73_02035 [Syntrophobacterales bacterium]|jgi:hypothetical protein|nr:hypothetical protein [Syntrophobacterales bacterium]
MARAPKPKARTGLAPLAPELQARLESQIAQVAAALQAEAGLDALKALVTPDPQDFEWDVHLMAALGAVKHPAMAPLLAALFGEARDKVRRKALKKTLHQLQTRGIAVPHDLLPREEVQVGAPRPGTAKALVSPLFGDGDCYLILQGPPEVLRGNFLVSRLSETEGLKECVLLNLKRQQQDEFWAQFREQGLDEWFDIPPAYAVRLLDEAYRSQPDNDAGYRFAGLREKIVGHWGRPESAPDPVEALPPIPASERPRLLEHSRRLAMDSLFRSWIPGVEEIGPWLEKLAEVQKSPLVLSEPQKQVRLDAVLDEATRALYPPDNRGNWGRRLKAMAYYLHLKGREEDSQAALATAEDLAAPETSALTGESLFLKGLVQQTLLLVWQMHQPEEPGGASGLVAPPGDSLLIRR